MMLIKTINKTTKMAWSNQEISQFQIDNNKVLAEINATLRPDEGLGGRAAVFCQGQMGDLMTCMSVLKYRKEIFGNKQIIWYANFPNAEALKYAPISEIRPWPWPGNGLPPEHPGDLYPILCDENNRLNKELAKEYELTADLDDGWFPAAWQLPANKRHGIDYPCVSKKVFNIPDHYVWHPVLNFSDEERLAADEFINDQMPGKKCFIESFAGSGQSLLNEEMISRAMGICNEKWGECNFIFASHKFLRAQEKFPAYLFQQPGVYSCDNFTVRQCALIAEKCDIMISVSSGITVACSAWSIKQPKTIQFAGSFICSTKSLANGRFELVTADDKTFENAKNEFYEKLKQLLNEPNS